MPSNEQPYSSENSQEWNAVHGTSDYCMISDDKKHVGVDKGSPEGDKTAISAWYRGKLIFQRIIDKIRR